MWKTAFAVSFVFVGVSFADIGGSPTQVACEKVGVAKEGGPDLGAYNEKLGRSKDSVKSVSVTFLGNSTYLICQAAEKAKERPGPQEENAQ